MICCSETGKVFTYHYKSSFVASRGKLESTTCHHCLGICLCFVPSSRFCTGPGLTQAGAHPVPRADTSAQRLGKNYLCSRWPRLQSDRKLPYLAGNRKLGKPCLGHWKLRMCRWDTVLKGRYIRRNIAVSDPRRSPVLPGETRGKLSLQNTNSLDSQAYCPSVMICCVL